MTNEQYQAAQDQIVLIARMVWNGLPFDHVLEEMLVMIDRADAAGPYRNPTLWREGHRKMYQVRELIRKLRAVRAELQRQLDEDVAEQERRRA